MTDENPIIEEQPDALRQGVEENVVESLSPANNARIMTREQIFTHVLKSGGKSVEGTHGSVDLTTEHDSRVSEVKEATMKAREVVLEKHRMVVLLKEQIGLMTKDVDRYCDELGVSDDDGLRADLEAAIPQIQEYLNQPIEKIFGEGGIDLDSIATDVNDYLHDSMHSSIEAADMSGVASQVLKTELQMAVMTLHRMRMRPVLAHRARGFHPDESSKEALSAAIEQNVMELEFDIRSSKDGHPMIHHNATLGASADREEAVRDMTAEELREVTLKNGGHMMGLRDFFEIVNAHGNKGTKINIDIKDFDEGMLDEMMNLVHEYGFEHRAVFVSWFPQALQYLYEKDPTLSYSLSYFPTIRGVSKKIASMIEGLGAKTIPGAKGIINRFASWASKKRGTMKNERGMQGTGGEMITDAYLLDTQTHWSTMKAEAETKGGDLVGRHTFAMGPAPVEKGGGMDAMARVLEHGSVNVMAFEETLLPETLQRFGFSRNKRMLEFARQCEANGVKVNLFDVIQGEQLERHFATFEELRNFEGDDANGGVQPGVVYSSAPSLIPRFKAAYGDADDRETRQDIFTAMSEPSSQKDVAA